MIFLLVREHGGIENKKLKPQKKAHKAKKSQPLRKDKNGLRLATKHENALSNPSHDKERAEGG